MDVQLNEQSHDCGQLPKGIAAAVVKGATILINSGSPFAHLRDLRRIPSIGGVSVSRPMRRLGFWRAHVGEDRAVFLHRSGWCLKMSHSPGLDWANQRELDLLVSLDPGDRRHFAETYPLSSAVLIQRTYAIDVDRFNDLIVENAEFRRAILRLGIMDISENNVGWARDGRWVFIDWAGKISDRPFARW